MSTPPNPPGFPYGEQPPEGWQPYGYGPQPGPQFPPPSGYPPPQPYPGYPPGYPGYGPQAPFGTDPATGVPLSDKSATTAGLLQLFLGSFGAGRFYIESTQIAVAQLCVGIFGIFFTVFCLFGLPVLLGSIVWAVVDATMIFTGSVNDGAGRKLR